jgi:predicted nucleic acid-binding protein
MSVGPTDKVVVDASVAVKWLLGDEEHTDRARLLLRRFGHGELQLVVPSHLRFEVPSAITAATLGRTPRLRPDEAKESIEEFLSLPLQSIDTDELILSAYPLVHRFGCAFYDALYLALSQSLHAPLITADRRFYQRIQQLPDIVWLGDYR